MSFNTAALHGPVRQRRIGLRQTTPRTRAPVPRAIGTSRAARRGAANQPIAPTQRLRTRVGSPLVTTKQHQRTFKARRKLRRAGRQRRTPPLRLSARPEQHHSPCAPRPAPPQPHRDAAARDEMHFFRIGSNSSATTLAALSSAALTSRATGQAPATPTALSMRDWAPLISFRASSLASICSLWPSARPRPSVFSVPPAALPHPRRTAFASSFRIVTGMP